MTVQVLYKKVSNLAIFKNLVIFTNEKFQVDHLKKELPLKDFSLIKNFLKNKDYLKKKIINFNLNSNQTVILVSLKKNLSSNEIEKIGANFFEFIKNHSFFETSVFYESIKINQLREVSLDEFLHGLQLKSYDFNVYKSKKNTNNFKINILSKKTKKNFSYNKNFKSLETGVNFARDLVSEPPNVLTPKEYVKRLLKLRKHGIKVTIYNETSLKKLKMFSLLGVGQGSINESYLVTLEWYGNKKNKAKLLSFVGKGVCFDTGGISLKPAKFMEEMKYDMAGSAVVAGLIKNLAMRKSTVNAVGVVGLVENMPGGNAQRPGDIVKSYSGKTIEVLNTDAEGRLVLADALSFTEKKFKPKCIIDLATLTGAIIMALGEEYAGLFSNNNDLSSKIEKAGEKVGEKVWRLPLHENYDKLMNSPVADIQNINYAGGAGSITAAQFLQRFILNKTPWAHLDIAGMAFSKKAANLNSGGATGFGVRLLNKFIEENYE
jgi:leucyl aminopeptidase